ncbi:MAG: YqeG family HAD IIIA-type phosphatase [Armatimonadota bacterium]
MKPWLPDHCVRHVRELTPEWLGERGIRGLVADLDNTLVGWHEEAIPEDVLAWSRALGNAGIPLCIASNTWNFGRLRRVAHTLGAEHHPGNAGKPGTRGVGDSLSRLGLTAADAAMVGDQLFTDMVAGRRAGLATILVNPLSSREFIGTRLVSRNLERLVLRGDRARPR